MEREEISCKGGKYVQIEQQTTFKTKNRRTNKKKKLYTVTARQDGRNKKDLFNILWELNVILLNKDQESQITILLP